MKRLWKYLATLAVGTATLSVAVFLAQPGLSLSELFNAPVSSGKEIDLAQVLQSLQQPGMMALDVRSDGRFAEGRIPHAANLPADRVERWPGSLATVLTNKASVLIYGAGDSGDVYHAGLALRQRGWKGETLLFTAGWRLWVRCGLPIEKGAVDGTGK